MTQDEATFRAPLQRKLAQPNEKPTTPFRMVTCRVHRSVHRERVTCVQPRAD